MKLSHGVSMYVASACFAAALPFPNTGGGDAIQLLRGAGATSVRSFPDHPLGSTNDPIADPPPSSQRRADDTFATLLRGAVVLAMASPAENGEWKVHVSVAPNIPRATFDTIFERHEEDELGFGLMSQLTSTLEMHNPGVAIADSHRGVFAAYTDTGPRLLMLMGREWRVRIQDLRAVNSYMSLIERYFVGNYGAGEVVGGVVSDAHVGADPARFRNAWNRYL